MSANEIHVRPRCNASKLRERGRITLLVMCHNDDAYCTTVEITQLFLLNEKSGNACRICREIWDVHNEPHSDISYACAIVPSADEKGVPCVLLRRSYCA